LSFPSAQALNSLDNYTKVELNLQIKIRINYRKITLGAVVEDVRIVFERLNDASVYIPDFHDANKSLL